MRKRTIKSQSTSQPKKQAKITAFTTKQHSSKLLKSCDGLKQGRIEAFMVKRSQDTFRNCKYNETKKSEKLVNFESMQSQNPLKKGDSTHMSVPIVDLTDVDLEDDDTSKSRSALLEPNLEISTLSNSPPSVEITLTEQACKCDSTSHEMHSEVINASFECANSSEATVSADCTEVSNVHTNESSCDSVNIDLNDSFLNAAFSDSSPVKEPNEASDRLLPFSLPCNSTSHSLAGVRYKVMEVAGSTGTNPSKTLILENVASRKKLECKLCDGWQMMHVVSGDIVNLIGKPDNLEHETITINNKNNLIIMHPDILLSGTSLSNAIACKRRAILAERFKNTEIGKSKISMLIGTIVHTLFQTAVTQKEKLSAEELCDLAKSELSKPHILRDILVCDSSQSELLKAVDEFIPKIIKFCDEYVMDTPCVSKGTLELKLPAGYKNVQLGIEDDGNQHKYAANISLSEVRDIEENVWSPTYGLKGKIDVSGTFLVKRRISSKSAKVNMPLELKTGRSSHSIEHYAQVAIYGIFSRLRGGKKLSEDSIVLPAGLLLYLRNMELSCVPVKRADERELLLIRNQIVTSLTKSLVETSKAAYEPTPFPPVINDERLCKMCSQLRNCSLISRSVDKAKSNLLPPFMSDLITENTSHLKITDLNYFNHWLTCTLLETRKSMKDDLAQYYWLRSPKEREQAGSCIPDLVLAGPHKSSASGSGYLQAFKKSPGCLDSTLEFVDFCVGEQVVISGKEPMFVAMASGSVFDISQNFITIKTERCFESYDVDMKYSIDKHEWSSSSSFNSSFQNISILMQDTQTASNLRNLVVHCKHPTFKENLLQVIPRSSKDEIAKMLRGLNRTQRQAIKRVLLSNDYTLVVGMPGSGKTTTIVAMVRILLLCGCRILITSYTHSAIDTLLVKLIKYNVKFLRLGRLSQIHPAVRKFSEEELCRDVKTADELDQIYSNSNIVGCTCIAASTHPIFIGSAKHSKFDICIVDEASQISQPSCLAPLFHASRFVLVGDHQQLPPLIRSRKARSIDADESLFRRLTCNEDALCYLTLQYRMNSAIMDVSNYVTYEGRLECATEATANATLDLPLLSTVKSCIMKKDSFVLNGKSTNENGWILTALDPLKPVVFINTSKIAAYEEEVDKGLCNKFEADILKIIVQLLLEAGCNTSSIGVIAPFRKQVKLIEEYLTSITDAKVGDVEVSTVDKYQGRDKDVILMSFVRSRNDDSKAKVGELLNDHRRLNVALTRAKRKMILVGCQKTLPAYKPCRKLLEYLAKKKLILSV